MRGYRPRRAGSIIRGKQVSTETELEQARQETLRITMDELSGLREQAMALPDQSQVESVIESIDFWEPTLKEIIDYGQLLEWCGRAIADVTHEIAAEKCGWESAEAD